MLFRKTKHYLKQLVALEISRTSRYYDQLIQWAPLPHDNGDLFAAVECDRKLEVTVETSFPNIKTPSHHRTLVLLNGNLNHHLDIQSFLTDLKHKLSRSTRVCVVAYNPYFRWLYQLANHLGIRAGEIPCTFMTHTELNNLVKLAGYEVVRIRPTAYFPWPLFGVGGILNTVLPIIPLLRQFSFVSILLLRPVIRSLDKPSLSIVIPASNEKGNIENALLRMPDLEASDLEIIFVEGHSRDGTWEEIQRVAQKYANQFKIKCLQQSGTGKSDAVRLGFSHAQGELLTILDADLTMPPERLGRFYEAFCSGLADFINGNRLLYPMEGEAMRFLNRLGNIVFAKMLSIVLDTKLGDSLCGTKLFSRHDYQRMVEWRDDFGDFDPFGDYELLFPAAILGLGMIDVPVHYRARTYGLTNIHRFRHGWMLLKMLLVGLFRVKMGDLHIRQIDDRDRARE